MADPKPNGHDEIRAATSEIEASQSFRALDAALIDRIQFFRQAGLSFHDARDLYEILGYDREISAAQYRERYERGGIAGTIVDVMPDATWRGGMELVEDEDPENNTTFELAWKDLDERLNLTTYMHRADKLSRLSDYAVLLLGVADANLSTELPKASPDKLLYVKPYLGAGGPDPTNRNRTVGSLGAGATIHEYELDASNPRFGLPKFYRLTQVMTAAPLDLVHWSRVIHVAEGCLEDDVFGRSALKRVWNLLDDLDKVTGGGSEAFWLRANQGLQLDVDKDMSLEASKDTIAKLNEQKEAYKHQIDRWLRTRGVDVKVLGSDVANFSNPADAILKQISGATRVPTRILTGSEMGELASSQDRENFKDQINGRQEQQTGPSLVRQLVDRLIKYAYLPTPQKGPRKYRVKWAHIQTMTEQEKVDGAKGWASVNQTQGTPIFTEAEIREKWADKAPLTDEQKAEALAEKQAAAAVAAPPVTEGVAPGDVPVEAPANDPASLIDQMLAETELKAAGDVTGHPFHGNQWTSGKDPATMHGSHINKELDKLDKESSAIISKMIEAGRGSEKFSDSATKTDDLAMQRIAVERRAQDLRQEIMNRYGPNAPSRLPHNVGRSPRVKITVAESDVELLNAAAFDESKHERGHGGQFGHGGSKSGSSAHTAITTKSSGHHVATIAHHDAASAKQTAHAAVAHLKEKGFHEEHGKLVSETHTASVTVKPDHSVAITIKAHHPKLRHAEAPIEYRRAYRIAQDKPREFSLTQVQLPMILAKKLLAYGRSISDADLAEDGREDDPHVTVKYGLHTNDWADVENEIAGFDVIELTLGKTAFFEADDYDVLYVAVESPDLVKLNTLIASSLDVTDTHPKYVPHACVAYLKSGLGEQYAGDDRFEGLTARISSIVFSNQDSEKHVIASGLRAAVDAPEFAEILRALEQAIEVDDAVAIATILGLNVDA